MIGIHETAYPHLKQDFTEQELREIYTPTDEERVFVTSQYRQATHRAYLLIQLKLLQRLGYFISLATIPRILVEHICSSSGLRTPLKTELIRCSNLCLSSVSTYRRLCSSSAISCALSLLSSLISFFRSLNLHHHGNREEFGCSHS